MMDLFGDKLKQELAREMFESDAGLFLTGGWAASQYDMWLSTNLNYANNKYERYAEIAMRTIQRRADG